MSESVKNGKPERDWHLYVDDMISFAEKVLAYTDGLERAQFEASGLTYDATVRNLELIGGQLHMFPLRCGNLCLTSNGARSFQCATA